MMGKLLLSKLLLLLLHQQPMMLLLLKLKPQKLLVRIFQLMRVSRGR